MTDPAAVLAIRRRPLLIDPASLPGTLHPVLRRVYAARGVRDQAQLSFGLDRLESHRELNHIEDAAALLADAISSGRRILVVGDFDTDGATSTALAILGLRAMGARQPDFLVPNRFEYGYGLTPEIVEVALARRPDLIVTVDNGISSFDGVSAAREAGVDVLVTDHHLPGNRLPEANVIVNPNLEGDAFPSKHLAGVGVMFYVLAALRGKLRQRGWFESQSIAEPRLADFLDLVALGTVADVVPLDYNNRVLVANGLMRIRAGKARPGIQALLEQSGRSCSRCVASDLGFAVAPRLNAAGRLDDMSLGIACLLEEDSFRARTLASELDGLNRERREIESGMHDEALAMVDGILDGEASSALPFGLCLYDERWHPGVIGIVASRVKDRFHRPTIVFAPDQDERMRGSARSVSGIHIRDVLEAVATRHPGLLEKFGGHAMAAGLTLAQRNFTVFCEAFDEEIRRLTDGSLLDGVLWSDGDIEGEHLGFELAQSLRDGGPWGQAFQAPLFDGLFRVEQSRVVGEKHLKLMVTPLDGGRTIDAIAFGQASAGSPQLPKQVRLAYHLDVNEFRGELSPQLVVEQIGAAD